jgi:hypothetical protein
MRSEIVFDLLLFWQVKQRRQGAQKAAKRRAKLDLERAKNGELDEDIVEK